MKHTSFWRSGLLENTCSLDDHILNLEIGGLLPDFQGGGELPVYGGPTEGLFSTQALPKEIGSQLQCSSLLEPGFWSINLNQNVWLVLSHIPPAWSSTHYHLLHVQYIFHVEWLICVGCKAPQCVASHLWNYCIHTLFLHISKCCKHVLWSNCFASKNAVA